MKKMGNSGSEVRNADREIDRFLLHKRLDKALHLRKDDTAQWRANHRATNACRR